MLKINLLPQEKGRRASSAGSMASMLLVAVVGSLVLLLGGLFLFHASQQSELDEIVATNNRMQSEIDSIKSRVSDHQKILDELAEIRRREEAIQQLQAARTGPTAMLVEISRILSPGGAPTADPAVVDHLRQHDRSRLWSPTWDTHRVWLTGFQEDNRNVTIKGETVKIEGTSGVTIESKARLDLKGTTGAKVDGGPNLELMASGAAKLQSSGQLTVKGSITMIN